MGEIQVFLDADVVISAMLSETGASYAIINNRKVKKIISKGILKEVEVVLTRLKISPVAARKLLRNIRVIPLKTSKRIILKNFRRYIYDEEDAHVIAGAVISKSMILLTHNLRHYKVNKINSDLGIILFKPGNFLQYLRSLDKL